MIKLTKLLIIHQPFVYSIAFSVFVVSEHLILTLATDMRICCLIMHEYEYVSKGFQKVYEGALQLYPCWALGKYIFKC